jgi:hypothetical protein
MESFESETVLLGTDVCELLLECNTFEAEFTEDFGHSFTVFFEMSYLSSSVTISLVARSFLILELQSGITCCIILELKFKVSEVLKLSDEGVWEIITVDETEDAFATQTTILR